MKNEQPGVPTFLENTPNVICDQVLWLIKNSGLNFQIKETPFSLEIHLKKRFANHWNQINGNPVPVQSPPHVFTQPNHDPKPDNQQNNSELLCQVLKADLDKASLHNSEAAKELFELDKVHRKLAKENKELLNKHEEVCSQLKTLKKEKESSEKEKNALSVALKASKKNVDESLGKFEKERNHYKLEIEKLNQFKLEKDAELRAIRKAEKKQRQKTKKEATITKVQEDAAAEDVPIKADQIEDPRPVLKPKRIKARAQTVYNTSVLNSEDVEEEASETCEPVNSISNSSGSAPLTRSDESFDTLIHAKATIDPDTTDDHGHISDTNEVEPISTASAPLTKDDLKVVWEFFAERSERIKSWNVST